MHVGGAMQVTPLFMASLNAKVDVDKKSVEQVAENFLKKHDLL